MYLYIIIKIQNINKLNLRKMENLRLLNSLKVAQKVDNMMQDEFRGIMQEYNATEWRFIGDDEDIEDTADDLRDALKRYGIDIEEVDIDY